MKINYLELQAFGPFLEKQKVHFDRLNEAEIFLITGPTGAGKTTIFDAICFALYGESSGEIREPSFFRNQQAPDDIDTYVELTFEVHGKTYTIRREPSYARIHYKTAHPSSVVLKTEDQLYTGKNEVNQQIVSIIGVESSQFRQVAMLSQGGFDKLIRANTKEKEKIFRELFSTHVYQSLQEYVKKEQKAKETAHEQCKTALDTAVEPYREVLAEEDILTYLKQQIVENEAKEARAKASVESTNQSLAIKNQELEIALRKEALEAQLATSQKQKNEMDEQKSHHQATKDHLKTLYQVKEMLSLDKQYEEKKAMVEGLHTQKEQLEVKLNQATINKQKIDEKQVNYQDNQTQITCLNQEKQHLEEDLTRLMNYSKINQRKEKAKAQWEKRKAEVQSFTTQKEQLQQKIDEIKDTLMQFSQIESLTSDIHHLSQAVSELSSRYEKAQNYQKQYDECLKHYMTSKNNYEALTLKQRQVSDLKLSHEQSYRLNLAGILASQLEEGMACPVCGSTHHPCKATLEAENITADILKQDEAMLQKLNQEVEKALAVYAKYDKQRQTLETLLAQDPLDACEQLYLSKKQLLNEKKDRCNALQVKKDAYEKELMIINQEMVQKQEAFIQASQALEIEEEQYKIAQTTFLALKESLKEGHTNTNELMKQLSQINRDLRNLTKAVDDYENNRESIYKQYNHLSGQYETLVESYQMAMDQAMESEQIFLEALPFERSYYQHLKQDIDKISQLEDEVKSYDERYYAIISSAIDLKNKLDGLQAAPSDNLKAEITSLQNERDEALVLLTQSTQLIKQSRHDYARIDVCRKELKMAEEKFQEVNDLYQLLSGNNALKLSFETYILSVYFDAVVERANLRMVEMTNGRYTMSRKEASGGRGLQGLELEVLDYESGKKRDIKTLSGGETFKASLSLALGLADLVSENTGGVVLDTLFIDEGFGSLDPLSLDLAMDTLLNLKQDRKVIGIISHVPALSERIDTCLEVRHTKASSFIKING